MVGTMAIIDTFFLILKNDFLNLYFNFRGTYTYRFDT